MRRGLTILLALLPLGGPACTELECGEGTHEAQSTCVANVLTRCGDGTRYLNGFCELEPGAASDADADASAVTDAPDEAR